MTKANFWYFFDNIAAISTRHNTQKGNSKIDNDDIKYQNKPLKEMKNCFVSSRHDIQSTTAWTISFTSQNLHNSQTTRHTSKKDKRRETLISKHKLFTLPQPYLTSEKSHCLAEEESRNTKQRQIPSEFYLLCDCLSVGAVSTIIVFELCLRFLAP